MKGFRRSKRGMFGVGIIIFYAVIAGAAPLFTPNDPAYGYYVSSDYATPAWFKYLGTESSEDINPIKDPAFRSAQSLLGNVGTRDWNLTSTSAQKSNVTLQFSGDTGSPQDRGGSGPGCARIIFRRTDTNTPAGTVTAYLTNRFFYPYLASPKRFAANISLFATGAEDVPVTVTVQITNSSSFNYNLWSSPTIENTTIAWTIPKIDSYMPEVQSSIATVIGKKPPLDVAKEIFSTKSYYEYTVQIRFADTKTIRIDKSISVYVDDISLRLYGDAYGVLGTDQWGRDIFAQLLYGARISLFVGLLSAVVSVVIGLLIGLISAYVGGFTDEIIMRLTDALLVLPGLPLLLVLIAVLGPSIWNLILVIGVLGWMGFARMVRSQTLSLKERPFVEAAKAIGAGRWHIMATHILPNVMSLVYVSLALSVPTAILSEAALSFLGLFDPSVMSWGRMLYDAQRFQGVERWWWVVPPGLSIALVSLSFILMGYALDELLNPKLRQRR